MIIQEELYKTNQSWRYKKITKHISGYKGYEEKSDKILVDINIDFYKSQSFWRVYVWRNDWKLVTDIPADKACTSNIVWSEKINQTEISQFRDDAKILEKLAIGVID